MSSLTSLIAFTALVLPHNQVLDPQTQAFLTKNTKPNTFQNIVIISPNHDDTGPYIQESDRDHGIQVPYNNLKKFFPNAKYNFYILRRNYDLESIQNFNQKIKKEYNPKKTLLVYSTDFSHYTSKEVAQKKDQETQKAILQYDLEKILNFKPENLDCPECIISMLTINKRSKIVRQKYLYLEQTSYWWGKLI